MTLRELVACSMHSRAVQIFALSLDPHCGGISFHDPSPSSHQHLHPRGGRYLPQIVVCPLRRCVSSCCTLHHTVPVYHPPARQSIQWFHPIPLSSQSGDLPVLFWTFQVQQKPRTHLCPLALCLHTAVSWDGWEPISLLQLAMPLLVHTIIALVHWRSSGYWNRPTWSLLRNPPGQWRNLTGTPLWHLMASVLLCTQDLAVPGQSLWASTCIGLVETNHCRAAEVFS